MQENQWLDNPLHSIASSLSVRPYQKTETKADWMML